MFRKKQAPPPAGRQRVERTNTVAAFSYHARRSEPVNPADERRQALATGGSRHTKRWRIRKTLAVISLAIITCATLYNVTLATRPSIVVEPSTASQAVLRDPEVYVQKAQEIIDASALNKNKVTITTTEVSRQLLEQYPELSNAQLVLPFFGRQPVLHVRAAEPVLLLATSNGTYALGSSGTALVTGAQLSQLGSAKLPLLTDENGIPARLYDQALTSQNVRFVRNIAVQLAAKDIRVASYTLPPGANALTVRLEGRPYYIKFNLASDTPVEQAGTLLALLERLQSQNIVPTEYIDVRVEGRAYYK